MLYWRHAKEGQDNFPTIATVLTRIYTPEEPNTMLYGEGTDAHDRVKEIRDAHDERVHKENNEMMQYVDNMTLEDFIDMLDPAIIE